MVKFPQPLPNMLLKTLFLLLHPFTVPLGQQRLCQWGREQQALWPGVSVPQAVPQGCFPTMSRLTAEMFP